MARNAGVTVIKYGGAAMDDRDSVQVLMQELVELQRSGLRAVLVHGGGPEIDRMLKRLHIEPKKSQGLRITDAETMEVVEMVLAGKVNKGLVAMVQSLGGAAVGLTGKDGGVVQAEKKKVEGVELGLVGAIRRCDPKLLISLLDAGYLPVLCSVAADADGTALNINADEMASEVAGSLGAELFLLLTDVPGVMRRYPDPDSVISSMTRPEAEDLLRSGAIDRGMVPKINACLSALCSGVREARILDGRRPGALRSALTGGADGTSIRA